MIILDPEPATLALQPFVHSRERVVGAVGAASLPPKRGWHHEIQRIGALVVAQDGMTRLLGQAHEISG